MLSNGSCGHKGEMEPMAHNICSETLGLKRYMLWACEEALIEILKHQLFINYFVLHFSSLIAVTCLSVLVVLFGDAGR